MFFLGAWRPIQETTLIGGIDPTVERVATQDHGSVVVVPDNIEVLSYLSLALTKVTFCLILNAPMSNVVVTWSPLPFGQTHLMVVGEQSGP